MSSEAARIRQQEVLTLRAELEEEKDKNHALRELVEDGEEARRRMHNQIQELKGSVRVFVRARPFLEADGEDSSEQVICR